MTRAVYNSVKYVCVCKNVNKRYLMNFLCLIIDAEVTHADYNTVLINILMCLRQTVL